ncbi:MAG: hypothetical protein P4N41_18940 [Negativicutes bacterium]|nr:hypothetical protein [Negativicutes bacterium]
MFSKTAYAIRTSTGKYLYARIGRLGLQIIQVESPEMALIWMDRKQAEDLLYHVQQHSGEKCGIVQFNLIEKAS